MSHTPTCPEISYVKKLPRHYPLRPSVLPYQFLQWTRIEKFTAAKRKKKEQNSNKSCIGPCWAFFFIKSLFTWHYVTSLVSVRMVMQIFVIIYQIDSCLLVFVTIVTLEEFISFFIFSFNISVCKGFHHNFLLHLAILYLLWFQRNWYFHDQDETKSQ